MDQRTVQKTFLSERAGDPTTQVSVPGNPVASFLSPVSTAEVPTAQPSGSWLTAAPEAIINATDVGAGPFIALVEQNRPYLEQFGERHLDLEIPASGDTYRTFKSHLEGRGYRVDLKNMRFELLTKWYDVTVSW